MIGLWNLAQRTPERLAAIESDTGRTVTRGELAARTHQVVHALRRRGVQTGGVVAMVMDNEIPLLEVFFAGLQAGWYVVPINYHFTADEIGYILADSDTQAVVCSGRHGDVVRQAAISAGIPPDMQIATGGAEGFVDYDEMLRAEPTAVPDGRTAGWMMTYTSGTTGRPKGIKRPLSGMNPDDVGEVWSLPMRIFGIEGEDHVHLVQSPIYHTAVLVYANASAQFGHTIVLMRSWDAADALRQIERHRVTTSHMVPTHFHRLLQLPDEIKTRHDLSSLRYAVHGAAPCPVATKQAMMQWWGPVVYEYYGASEGGGTTVSPEEWLERPGTVGRPWPNAQIRILSPEGDELPAGEHGEVWMFAGALDFEYHNSSDKTAASKRDGFFTVGDIGHLDDEGYLYLHGRSSDIIITGGVNIHPSEVEAVLLEYPGVDDVAVFGIPDAEWGEQIKAVVQTSMPPDTNFAAALANFCRERLANYKVPRSIDFVEELPRDPNGKLYKRQLRERYWNEQATS